MRVAGAYDEQPVLDVLRADGDATGRQPSKARLAAVRATLRSPATLTLVAVSDGAVLGFVLAELAPDDEADDAPAADPSRPRLHVPVLCVAPRSRRSGVGRALVRALLARFADVSTWSCDVATTSLLTSEGFVPTGRTREVAGRSAEHLVHRRA